MSNRTCGAGGVRRFISNICKPNLLIKPVVVQHNQYNFDSWAQPMQPWLLNSHRIKPMTASPFIAFINSGPAAAAFMAPFFVMLFIAGRPPRVPWECKCHPRQASLNHTKHDKSCIHSHRSMSTIAASVNTCTHQNTPLNEIGLCLKSVVWVGDYITTTMVLPVVVVVVVPFSVY